MGRKDLIRRVQEYADRRRFVLGGQLGSGVHGIVFSVQCQTDNGRAALKVHERSTDYSRERDVYLRLREHGITELHAFNVPELLGYDDDLLVIEMTVVTRPFVLDFAGAFLDQAPDFPEEVMAEWRLEKQEQFGGRWNDVQAILQALEDYGVFMVDVNPGNISFGD